MKGPLLTLPNIISILRVPLSASASALLLAGRPLPSAVLASTAVITDWLDGLVARRSGSSSEWGRVLDPAADKISFALFGLALLLLGRIPPWFFVLLLLRDLLVAGGGLLLAGRSRRMPSSNIGGKISTVLLAGYLLKQAFLPGSAGPSLLGLDLCGLAALAALTASTAWYAAGAVRP